MTRRLLSLLILPALLAACAPPPPGSGTIAQLRSQQIEIREAQLTGGLEKAMASYQQFLEETPDSALVPDAIRRLADLKVEKEYGLVADGSQEQQPAPAAALSAPQPAAPVAAASQPQPAPAPAGSGESDVDFEQRAALSPAAAGAPAAAADHPASAAEDLERAGPLEAIALYQKLLAKYPLYEHNDQVLYQMSRAYEELGRIEEAMAVMDRLVREFPHSRYLDEVQFRRAEYFFAHRKYLDAEDAYGSIVTIGVGSAYYQLALYKLGWTYYKQELYQEALHRFVALLDYKVSVGYDFEQTADETERKRIEDTFRVISLGFSYLGGATAADDYFARNGHRSFEDGIYSNLGEYYFAKRRYSDAVAAYGAFVKANPFHKKAPNFQMRIIAIDMAGGFPTLVIEAKKTFATQYGLTSAYWQHFVPAQRPEVLDFLKTNLTDLANHYHALYRDPQRVADKPANYQEALHWHREFLASFPHAAEAPGINYLLADLLMENRDFAAAAVEYEKTAYDYPRHEKSSQAGYAAVYAYRQQIAGLPKGRREPVRREMVRSSLKFAATYPEHEKAAVVLGAAADDLYDLQDYQPALAAGRQLIEKFPGAELAVRRSAWLVVAHSCFELQRYAEAEEGYGQVLALLPADDQGRATLVDNLAAAIYKQGEQARNAGDLYAAAAHFLRVGEKAPSSALHPTAEYDAAAVLMKIEDWETAAEVLERFRASFPGHELQPEVTKKIAYVYREQGKLAAAAGEYERIEREAKDEELRREALQVAAQLYQQAKDDAQALVVYRRFVGYFPAPLEPNLEARQKIAEILETQGEHGPYLKQLKEIVALDAAGGDGRTERTGYLAAKAGLVLAQEDFEAFAQVKLSKPFKKNLAKKKELMKRSMRAFSKLLDYQVGEVTAAATYYLAEIYANFSKALTASERPDNLSPLELEQYNLAIEDQAYPFEEKAISVHQSNLELIGRGIYNRWVDKSLQKLAVFIPARYARPEAASPILTSLESYSYVSDRPRPAIATRPAAGSGQQPAAQAQPAQGEAVAQPEPAPSVEGAASPQTETETQPEAAAPVATAPASVETDKDSGTPLAKTPAPVKTTTEAEASEATPAQEPAATATAPVDQQPSQPEAATPAATAPASLKTVKDDETPRIEAATAVETEPGKAGSDQVEESTPAGKTAPEPAGQVVHDGGSQGTSAQGGEQ